ncbi:MAG: 4Fe-4S dicluster domain-containing protein, partial [Actinomycetia bacterium]|nr:4Fe-4S dicluster domain-containing protein [Actinomycetes bacterium]
MEYIKQLSEKCSRCGKCKQVCPVYAELKNEIYISKGRLLLIKNFYSSKNLL